MQLPRWYCPVGITRPAHVPTIAAPIGCVPGVGPDVADNGPGGGTMYGGTFVPGEAGWVKTDAGWYVNLRDVVPQALQCAALNPRILRVAAVQGAAPSHWWQVPILLSPVGGDDDSPLYKSALDRVWTADGWKDGDELSRLQDRLLAVALSLGTGETSPDDETLVSLCLDILHLTNAATRDEVIAGGWLSQSMLLRVLLAAADIPVPERDA